MQRVVNKWLYVYGAFVCLTGLPYALFLSLEDVYDVYRLSSNAIEVSYFFAIAPVLLWILVLVLLGSYNLIAQKKLNLSGNAKKTLAVYAPIVACVLSLALAFIGKPIMSRYLLDNGYTWDYTKSASAPWRTDVDVYIRNK